MRCLSAVFLNILFACFFSLSAFAAGDTIVANVAKDSGPSIVGKNEGKSPEDFRYRLGENLPIRVTGELAKKVEAEWGKRTPFTLYFDGKHVADLTSPPERVADGQELRLNFTLVRKSDDDDNRKAWDSFFKSKHGYMMTVQPSIAIGNDLPLAVQSSKPFKFYVASGSFIILTIAVCVATLLVLFYLLTKTKMLRDAETNYYSLGKSQMAFWGLLVVLSFVGVWILTGTMERIPSQVLILLGISGATGLSAVVIGNRQTAEKQTRLAELRPEKQKLKEQRNSDPSAFSQESSDRLTAIVREIEKLEPDKSSGFWQDICDDGNGASFHRLQVVIWTLVLGAVFIQNVAQVMSMPEFSETLLTLMGISNATYVGFKIPEK